MEARLPFSNKEIKYSTLSEIDHKSPHEESQNLDETLSSNSRSRVLRRAFFAYQLLLHLALLSLTSFLAFHSFSTAVSPVKSFSPARSALSFESRKSYPDDKNHSIYSGPPIASTSLAWESLLQTSFFNASASELEAAGESVHDSLELVKGGYVASTSVFHDLHCLWRIKQYIYSAHSENLSPSKLLEKQNHLDHCLEGLRLSTMCTGDVSVYTFAWHKTPQMRQDIKTNSKRQCLNWESFENWGRKRVITVNDKVKGKKETVVKKYLP